MVSNTGEGRDCLKLCISVPKPELDVEEFIESAENRCTETGMGPDTGLSALALMADEFDSCLCGLRL